MMFSKDHHHPHHNIFLRHLGASQMLWLSSSPPMQSSSPSHFHLFGIHLEKKHLEKNTPRKNTPENHHNCYKLSWLWSITNTTKIVTTSDLQHKRKWSSSKKWSPSSTKIYHPQKNDEHHKKDHPDLWSLHSNSLTPHSSGLPPKKMWKWNWERTKLFGTMHYGKVSMGVVAFRISNFLPTLEENITFTFYINYFCLKLPL